ncbi:MAG: hypothetical protein ACI854_000555 [Arenicella sp.]|jgi:hypothetical protein
MKPYFSSLRQITVVLLAISSMLFVSAGQAQTASPPQLGEETKGTPAIEEQTAKVETPVAKTATSIDEKLSTKKTSLLGTSTIIESRRESGQIYSIELQHSNAPTQYIQETDSDGNIEFESNDLEETPNLPKWKIGSW